MMLGGINGGRVVNDADLWLFLVIITDEQVQEHYDEFFEEIFVELEEKVNVALFSVFLFQWNSWYFEIGLITKQCKID